MDFFQQQLNKNRKAFISVRELLTEIQNAAPGAKLSDIARAILLNDEQLLGHGITAAIEGIEGRVVDAPLSNVCALLNDIILENQIAERHMYDEADNSPDLLGWYRRLILPEIHKMGWPLGKLKGQAIEAFPVPQWFRQYLSRAYLSLSEASQIITNSSGDLYETNDEFNHANQNNLGMLQEAVKEGQISLDPGGASVIDHEQYWRLSTNDVRKLCHRNGLNWPVPWAGEPEQPLSTEVLQLQDQVKQLQKQISEYQRETAKLQKLEQENAALKTQIKKQDVNETPATGYVQDLHFYHKNIYLQLISELQHRFLKPGLFELDDSGSWPSQEKVFEWLDERAVLDSTDKRAIDRVAFPFYRANKRAITLKVKT